MEIAKEKFLSNDKTEQDLANMSKNIFLYQAFSIADFENL